MSTPNLSLFRLFEETFEQSFVTLLCTHLECWEVPPSFVFFPVARFHVEFLPFQRPGLRSVQSAAELRKAPPELRPLTKGGGKNCFTIWMAQIHEEGAGEAVAGVIKTISKCI